MEASHMTPVSLMRNGLCILMSSTGVSLEGLRMTLGHSAVPVNPN
jgi:hypothetical protein